MHRLDLGITRELAPSPALAPAVHGAGETVLGATVLDGLLDGAVPGSTALGAALGGTDAGRTDVGPTSGDVVGGGTSGGVAMTAAGSRPRGRVERPRYTFRDRLGRTRNGPASTMTPLRT